MTEYLRALEPTLTQQQHDRVTSIVKQFVSPSGLGPKLHQYLVEKRDAEDNWVKKERKKKRVLPLFQFRI